MEITTVTASSILTRTSGYLSEIASHSLNCYRGCGFGNSLCGVGCYVRHNLWITRGQPWGSFVEAKWNAAALYEKEYATEQRWGRRKTGRFGVFLSSATEPFQPAEQRYGITNGVLQKMLDRPPDRLILQTHSHRVTDAIQTLCQLKQVCDLRVHISIETDYDRFPGGPGHGSPVEKRLAAGRALRDQGVWTIATIAPLMPLRDPEQFFSRIADSFDAVVIDHYIEGDGSQSGSRTLRTPLPVLMQNVEPSSVSLGYRDRMIDIARRYVARVGVGRGGFAGRFVGQDGGDEAAPCDKM